MKNKINSAIFLGYDIRIIYDDYSTYEILIEDLKEIDNICKSLENRDDTFEVEYKKKYQLDNGSFVYSKKEHISIDNPNIPKRELLLRKFNNITQTIFHSLDVSDEDIKECYEILTDVMVLSNKNLNNENHKKVHQLTLSVSDEAYEHLVYLFKYMEGVKIVEDTVNDPIRTI